MRAGFHAMYHPNRRASRSPKLHIDDAVIVVKKQNLEIAIPRKQIQAARGGLVEARSGYLPSLVSTGLYDKREHQQDTRLRDEDYNVSRAGGRAQDATGKA